LTVFFILKPDPAGCGLGKVSFPFFLIHLVLLKRRNKKAMRGNAWLKVRLLAPYGGITRVRFKGSVAAATLSAHWLPRSVFSE
jgi:hypothetical protein